MYPLEVVIFWSPPVLFCRRVSRACPSWPSPTIPPGCSGTPPKARTRSDICRLRRRCGCAVNRFHFWKRQEKNGRKRFGGSLTQLGTP
eukprot:scaffold1941_cov97-Isochrysis_galbana.AAC.1